MSKSDECRPDCPLCAEPRDSSPTFICPCGAEQKDPNRCKRCGKFWVAHNRCNSCRAEWHAIPGPHTVCPKCGGIYSTWMNYPIEKPHWCEICKAEFK